MQRTVLVLLALLVLLPAPPAAAQQSGGISGATQQLFDAVRRKDMGASQAAIAAGADVDARNSLGLRAVDVAIDLGNFEIAHYLLSVSNLKIQAARETALQRPPVLPAPSQLSSEPPQPAPGVPAASPAFQVNRGSLPNIFATTPINPVPAPAAANPMPANPAPAAPSQVPAAPALSGPNPFDVQSAPRSFTLPVVGSSDPAVGPQSSVTPAPDAAPRAAPLAVPATVAPTTAAPMQTVPEAATPPPAPAPQVASIPPAPAPSAPPPAPSPSPASPSSAASSGVLDNVAAFFRRDASSPRPAPVEPDAAPETPAAVAPEPPAPSPAASSVVAPPPAEPAIAVPATTASSENASGLLARVTAFLTAPKTPSPEPAIPVSEPPAMAPLPEPPPEATPAPIAPTPTSAASSPAEPAPGLLDRLSNLLRPVAKPAVNPGPAEEHAALSPIPAGPTPIMPLKSAPEEIAVAAAPATVPAPVVSSAPTEKTDAPSKDTAGLLEKVRALFGDPATLADPAPRTADSSAPTGSTSTSSSTPPAAMVTARNFEPQAATSPSFSLPVVGQSFGAGDPVPTEATATPVPSPVTALVSAPASPAPAPAATVPPTAAANAQIQAKPGILDRVAGLFSKPKASGPASVPLAPTDKPTLSALAVEPAPNRPAPSHPTATLDDIAMGTSVRLGQSRLGRNLAPADCIEKRSWKSWFCLETVDWPDDIASSFDVSSALYRGKQAIVHYEDNIAVQVHAIFPTERFSAVVQHLSRQLGAPSEIPEIKTSMIAAPARNNPTVRWHAITAQGDIVLEVRQIDDLRMVMPDTQFGVVRLYRKGADPVFKLVSVSDLMLARLRSPAGG